MEADRSLSWIDIPVMDAVEYFAGTMGYFLSAAVQIGTIVGILAIAWSSIKLAFGTLEVQKAVVGTITKFLFFIAILNFYPSICTVVCNTAIEMGSEASDKPRTKLVGELSRFLKQMEEIVAAEDAEAAAELAAAVQSKEKLVDAAEKWEGRTAAGYSVGPSSEHIRSAQKRIDRAQKIIEARQENPTDNMRTVIAIRSVLKPMDEDGNETDASNASRYILDLYLDDTGYLSPNAMLRVAVLSAQIMWQKEWTSVVDEWDENDPAGKLSLVNFPFRRVFDIILVFVSMVCIVLCMIFSLLQYVACILEFTIVTVVAVLCLPCILMDELRDVAGKVMPAILSQAVKLTMITLCMFFSLWAFLGMAMDTIGEGGGFNLTTFAFVMFTILLSVALTQFAPRLASSLLTGQPQFSMGELVGVMGQAAAVGAGAVKAADIGRSVARSGRDAAAGAARGAVGAMGAANALVHANHAARAHTAAAGGGTDAQGRAGVRAMAGEAGYMARQALSSRLHGFVQNGMGAPGGARGSSGGFTNRFDYENDGYKREEHGQGSMRFGEARDRSGRTLTAREYVNERGDAAAERATARLGRTEKGQKDTPGER